MSKKKKSLIKIGWCDADLDTADMIYIHRNTDTIELGEIFDARNDALNNYQNIKKVRIIIEEL